ncbi:MAG: Metal-dependent hydrolase of the beta-lactamase superfamily [Candidatus Methanohalarchaeum thermophilum]|uniref:Metal-dependent hydrolase of the beta-lactamase superfamily n=1 Tax=Methanohalarchaeum thermophilum TaxID=1903181 RepID=A0A1Q6DUU1_METT1|nr:MAG: Metal-dependent hydrolase of the beta-lactamase superfamily [Candidatus Methanohalarchaeum thermophilum]
MEITFLGTGGGRFSTIYQRRKTGGIRFVDEKNNIHIDPGPGALLLSHRFDLNPLDINTVILTHAHPDHYNDIEVLIEAMTRGGTNKSGNFLSCESGLRKVGNFGPVVSEYHRDLTSRNVLLEEGNEIALKGNIEVSPKKVRHSDPSTHGLVIKTEEGRIGYTSDTSFFEGMRKKFEGSRLLVLNVTRPRDSSIKGHLSTEDAVKLVNEIEPEVVVLTHFGFKMLDKGPKKEAEFIEEKTDIKSIAAEDGMKIKFNEDINLRGITKPITRY